MILEQSKYADCLISVGNWIWSIFFFIERSKKKKSALSINKVILSIWLEISFSDFLIIFLIDCDKLFSFDKYSTSSINEKIFFFFHQILIILLLNFQDQWLYLFFYLSFEVIILFVILKSIILFSFNWFFFIKRS